MTAGTGLMEGNAQAGEHDTRSSLLRRVRDLDDVAGWDEFYEPYWKLVFQYGRRAGLSEADAKDLVQTVFRKVAAAMPGFVYDREKGSFRSWLLSVTHRRLSDHLRGERRRPGMAEPPEGFEGDFLDALPHPATSSGCGIGGDGRRRISPLAGGHKSPALPRRFRRATRRALAGGDRHPRGGRNGVDAS